MPRRQFALERLMRATPGNLILALTEQADMLAPVHPHLYVRLLHFARQIELALALARMSPHLMEIDMSDLNIVDLVSRVEAGMTAKDNEIVSLQSTVNKLQAQLDATTADTLSDAERAALVDLGGKFPAASPPPPAEQPTPAAEPVAGQ